MQFSKIIGKIDPGIIAKAEDKLSTIFLELATGYKNEHVGSGMGGDPLIFGLMYPIEHVCTMNIPTAATDGKRFYWNPKFVIKQSKIGLRIVCSHEAWHALYMHPQRRGSRLPKLWNIAVDFIVNGTVMEDFKARKMNPSEMFSKELGKFITLPQYAEMLKNPFAPVPGFDDLNPADVTPGDPSVTLPAADEDRALTAKEQKELERREKNVKFYYADPDLAEDMKRPEAIYDFLYALLPKCPKCGSIGKYSLPKKKDNGSGQGPGQSCNGDEPCDTCGGDVDIFDLGGTVDDHMDTSESQEKLAKRVADAMYAASKMAGHIPGALEDELGKLTAPKVTWQDIIRTRLIKARAGNGRNDWTRFRTRPMFAGLMVPKRKNYFAHFGCLLDTSGSMSKEDMAFGISQLASLDERSEGTIVPSDCTIYWDQATKVKKASTEELSKVKVVGRGGTMFATFFTDYEKNIGKCDFLIMITDGYLMDQDVAEMVDPGVPVYWIMTANSSFNPPFGRAFFLRD